MISYDDSIQAFKFINSWGTSKGINGYGYISYDMFLDNKICNGIGYIMLESSHEDANKFYTKNYVTQYMQAKEDVRAYKAENYYISNGNVDNYDYTIKKGDVVKINKFVSSKNGVQPYFITSDGYYVNAQKETWDFADENASVSKIFIN